MKRLIFVPFDQLNENYGALQSAQLGTDVIVLVESARMTTGRSWHPERLWFLISSARHFAKHLQDAGFTVRYVKAETTIHGLEQVRAEFGELPVVATHPSSFKQLQNLEEYGVEFVENNYFLTPREWFSEWASTQKSFLMENFYRKQRVRLKVLVEDSKPIGDRWNFDAENRLPPPKNYDWPKPLQFELDQIDIEVAKELGYQPSGAFGTTREAALNQLAHFMKVNFASFGPYEDAIPKSSWSAHHSLLSPYLNNGLLHAADVVRSALNEYHAGRIPLESCEGFLRQIIGWREYINGMYWFLGEDYRYRNELGANRKLLPLFTDSKSTKMNCMSSVVREVEQRGWTHHIPRLMLLSNLANLAGVQPSEFLDWMREQFIDAAEWVMVPNVIGMGLHADGGQLMTKPYVSGGAYISKMTQFCGECEYDPKKRVGENACPFTTLYWDYLDRHRDQFARNHRIAQQVRGLDRLSDLPELRERARQVLALLESGAI